MRRVATSVVLVLLAGCFGEGGGTADATPEGATSTTGVLRGVVVDDAIRPLGGANITVTGPQVALNATTGDDGLFRFTGLEPGTYLVQASKRYYLPLEVAVVVVAGVDEPEMARLQLPIEPSSVPIANVYKHEGFHECGFNWFRVCSNVNIATWIVVCGQTGGAVCVGNVTNDRSVFFQDIEGPPTFIQAELAWDPTTPVGAELAFLIGGGTVEELKGGVGLPAFNFTEGPSPLMVRVSNHEGPGAWCRQLEENPCTERALEDSKIGIERVLLGQVDAGPTVKTPVPCDVTFPDVCAAGWSMQQAFTLYTTVFFGYEPPMEWLFTETGQAPPPPA